MQPCRSKRPVAEGSGNDSVKRRSAKKRRWLRNAKSLRPFCKSLRAVATALAKPSAGRSTRGGARAPFGSRMRASSATALRRRAAPRTRRRRRRRAAAATPPTARVQRPRYKRCRRGALGRERGGARGSTLAAVALILASLVMALADGTLTSWFALCPALLRRGRSAWPAAATGSPSAAAAAPSHRK
eukprot:2909011-Pleurochrysis_carterae.AAC.1